MSADCSGFVRWPTSLLPAFSTFPGVYVTLFHLAIESSSSKACFLLWGKKCSQSGAWPSPACPPCMTNQETRSPSFVPQTFTWVSTLYQALNWTLGKEKWKSIYPCPALSTLCDRESFLGLFHLPIWRWKGAETWSIRGHGALNIVDLVHSGYSSPLHLCFHLEDPGPPHLTLSLLLWKFWAYVLQYISPCMWPSNPNKQLENPR